MTKDWTTKTLLKQVITYLIINRRNVNIVLFYCLV